MQNAMNDGVQNPPKLEPNTLRFVPLGGLGEVGRNMMSIEMIDPIKDGGFASPRILLVDCGVLFPGEDEPGVDLILPDFSYIADRLEDVEALLITHGHEDHIGAVPYLLKLRPDIEVVGNRLTIELVNKKLKEHKIQGRTRIVADLETVRFGPFEVKFMPVTHSIPDASAVFVKTAAGNFIHTGDFKMDQLPLDGRLSDLNNFSDAKKEGVDLFMTDSTNSEYPGFVVSEAEIGAEIAKIFSGIHSGKIIVSSFASHIHRIQHIFNAALRTGRKVCLVGRSMVQNMKIAADLELLDIHDVLVDQKAIESIPSEKLVLICTGSQGESRAALSRMANGEFPGIHINSEDTVIFASSSIPGNEKQIFGLMNDITKIGATIISSSNAKVHCSGHAQQGELRYIYNVVKPKAVIPVHGEPKHLLANAKVAESTGIDSNNIAVLVDGSVADLKDGFLNVVGKVECGYVFVDGTAVGHDMISVEDLKHRRILSEEGFVAVNVVIDIDQKKVIARPKVVTRGVAEDDSVFYKLPEKVVSALEKAMNDDGETNLHRLSQICRRTTGAWVAKRLRRAPMILPLLTNYQESLV